MSYLIAAPEYLAAAASDLANIASSMSAANAVAMTPTSGVLAAGADEVSAMIAALFSTHAQAYQALSAQAASFHAQFVQLMNGGASQYALTEAANASPMQSVGQAALGAATSPGQAMTGHSLIGNGANATTPAANGAPGGLLYASPAPAGTGVNSALGQAGSTGGGSGAGGWLYGQSASGGLGANGGGSASFVGTGNGGAGVRGGVLFGNGAVGALGGTEEGSIGAPPFAPLGGVSGASGNGINGGRLYGNGADGGIRGNSGNGEDVPSPTRPLDYGEAGSGGAFAGNAAYSEAAVPSTPPAGAAATPAPALLASDEAPDR
jgi:hypothetical protein